MAKTLYVKGRGTSPAERALWEKEWNALKPTRIQLIEKPLYGSYSVTGDDPAGVNVRYDYIPPSPDYRGEDRWSFLVDLSTGRRVLVRYQMSPGAGDLDECRMNLLSYVETVDPSDGGAGQASDLLTWIEQALRSTTLSTASNVSYTFSMLAGSAVGNTAGTGLAAQITLDTDAAGHGWYVDATPLSNTDDYLPTSDPTVWQAKPGSAAEGKMDMLSVLLHEYGHALGLEHSGNGSDFMAESLQPGQRKLPSAAKLSLMAQLVAQLKGEGSDTPDAPALPAFPAGMALAGLLGTRRRSEEPGDATQSLQKLLSVNPALQNTQFGQGSTQGWNVEGAVSAAGSAAAVTLAETNTAQTTLSQAFTLGEDDRFLSFTVDGLQLNGSAGTVPGGQHDAPADAFEVALLDAATYDPLLGDLGLSHSDALLNLQHDASGALAQRQGAGIYITHNADGSTTYTLDLRSLNMGNPSASAGRSVLLSFDLLGFGAADSAVTLRESRPSNSAS